MLSPIEPVLEDDQAGWRTWQAGLRSLDRRVNGHHTYRISTAVLRAHESPIYPGGLIAGLSIPWGATKGDDDLGGYHVVWPRDLVQTAGAFLACGANAETLRGLRYLRAVQQPDGRWPQNCWLDGTPYWGGLQLDECAFPILLVEMVWRHGALSRPELAGFLSMVQAAAGFVVRNGPMTPQDRWEEDAGYTPFTIAVQIAARLAAADPAEHCEAEGLADFLRDTADDWNERIESRIYAADTAPAQRCGVAGHSLRIVPTAAGEASAPRTVPVALRNRPSGMDAPAATDLVSVDALALVRFGLRAPDDPRVVDTVKVIDGVLKANLPQGPCWCRYNQDGYGELADGSGYEGTGIGRPWPLRAGERAHHELAAGARTGAEALPASIEAHGTPGAMLPEQVWDGLPIEERELFPGKPSGSAVPLVWAHAEHIKLLRSLADGAVFDMPPQTVRRYVQQKHAPRCRSWRQDWRSHDIPAGRVLRIELPEGAVVLWNDGRSQNWSDAATSDRGLGVHAVELATEGIPHGWALTFTRRRLRDDGWVGENFTVVVHAT